MSPGGAPWPVRHADQPRAHGPAGMLTEGREGLAGSNGVETLSARDDVFDVLAERIATTTTSFWSAHPDKGLGLEDVESWWEPIAEIAARGVEVRTLLPHSTRTHSTTQALAALSLPAGALLRTVPVIATRTFLFDGTTAISTWSADGRSEGAMLITDPGLVACLARGYEAEWVIAQEYPALLDAQGEAVSIDQTARTVLSLLADGHKDEVVARRLGCSVRTARRHVSSLMELLESSSRFQAGVRAAQAGLID